MIPVRSALAFLLVALGSCGTREGPPDSAAASQTGIELFVDPARSLYLEPDMPLGELLERYTQRMGWTLLVPEAAREKLAQRHCGFAERLEVPFGSVHGFVESLVRANGLLLRFEHTAVPVVLQVVDPEDKAQGDTPEHRVLVPLSEVPRWAAHPAHMITTQVPLPTGDAEVFVRNLRAIFGDAARGQVIKTGDANSVLFSGTGAEVARLVRVLGEATRGPAQPEVSSLAPAERASCIDLLHVPSRGLHLERPEQGELKLKDLVEQYTQLMGWHLLTGPDTKNQLRVLNCGITLPVEIPAENVHAFVEGILCANEFVLRFAHAREPVVLEIQSRNTAGPENPRRNAVFVPATELPRWAAHPAFLVSTVLDLPGVDVHTLSNSLRQMFSDQQTQQLIPVGSTSLLVTGYGSEVGGLATLLRALADAANGVHAPAPPAPAAARLLELFVPPPRPLRIEKPDYGEPTLQSLVDAYAGLMGWQLIEGPDTRNQLRTLRCGFNPPVEVAPDHVHAFVESVLKANDFVLGFAHAKDPVLLSVTSTNVAGRGNPRADAPFVPAAELPQWTAHPDFLITTCVDLPGVDVRTLSNSMRQMFSDQQTQQIIPVGNTDGLIVTGFGSDVADITTMLRSLSDAAAGVHVALPPIPRAASGIDLFVTPPKGLHLEKPERNELKLIELFDQYCQLMGWRILTDADTHNQLITLGCKLSLPLDVPPENVHTFVESVARANDLVLTFAHMREPVLLAIASTNVAGKGNPRKDATMVPASELSRWAAHPDFLITTTVDLPGIDVRTLSNSLRQMFSDQQTQQVIPLGNSDGLILTGFANDIATLASSLCELSRGGAGLQAPALPAPPAADRARLFPLGEGGFAIPAPDGKEATPIDVLEEFVRWTKRPLEISDDARKALAAGERKFAEPRTIAAQLAYPYVGLLLERARCTLSPVPPAAPEKWVVDVPRKAKGFVTPELPTIAFEDLGAWSAFCATPFRTFLKLPAGADSKLVDGILKAVTSGGVGCRVDLAGNGSLQLCGTPLEIQTTAYAILDACAPAPTGR